MKSSLFWIVTLNLMLIAPLRSEENSIGTLSDGACWYEMKEQLKVASFNDKTAYTGNLGAIESDLEEILTKVLHRTEKITDADFILHCSGMGASLVSKVVTESGSFCIWSRFEKEHLVARSVGAISQQLKADSELCDGHKWGEFILSVKEKEALNEFQSAKWTGMIKEIVPVSGQIYKVVLTKEYEFKETEVAQMIENHFTGKKVINYIEMNEYRHSVGEWIKWK